jgi:hypothetical protein
LLPQRLLATLAGFFGVLAVLVAAVGLYGVMSYLVVRRTNEIGVRMALGATRRNIIALILSHAAKLLIIGCTVGSLLAFGGANWVQSLVFGLEARSIAPVGLACILFALVAALACYLPAACAAKVDPRDALRKECVALDGVSCFQLGAIRRRRSTATPPAPSQRRRTAGFGVKAIIWARIKVFAAARAVCPRAHLTSEATLNSVGAEKFLTKNFTKPVKAGQRK